MAAGNPCCQSSKLFAINTHPRTGCHTEPVEVPSFIALQFGVIGHAIVRAAFFFPFLLEKSIFYPCRFINQKVIILLLKSGLWIYMNLENGCRLSAKRYCK